MRQLGQRYDASVPVNELNLHPQNARQGDVGEIYTSIAANGWYGAVLVQERTRYILAGNHRYRAALEHGAETVPVFFVDCDDETARRILLVDNRLNDKASWDETALVELLSDIQASSGLDGSGWTEDEYQDLLQQASEPMALDEPEKKKPDEAPPAEPRVKQHNVLVVCDDQAAQGVVYEKLSALGYICRLIVD